MNDHRVIHRFIAAGIKHGNKTACGIPLVTNPMGCGGSDVTEAVDDHGSFLRVATKGKAFDCDRCRAVLEAFRKGRVTV